MCRRQEAVKPKPWADTLCPSSCRTGRSAMPATAWKEVVIDGKAAFMFNRNGDYVSKSKRRRSGNTSTTVGHHWCVQHQHRMVDLIKISTHRCRLRAQHHHFFLSSSSTSSPLAASVLRPRLLSSMLFVISHLSVVACTRCSLSCRCQVAKLLETTGDLSCRSRVAATSYQK